MKISEGYSIQFASDAVRDGLGAELVDPNGTVVAEIFRFDQPHRVVINALGNEIPLLIFEEWLSKSRSRLDPFQDGTPLHGAATVLKPGG